MPYSHVEMSQNKLLSRYEELEAIESDIHPHKALEAAKEMLYIIFEMNQRSEEAGNILRADNGISAS